MSSTLAVETGSVVELQLAMPDPDLGTAGLATSLECRLTYQPGFAADTPEGRDVFVATGTEPTTLVAAAADRADLARPRLLTTYRETAVVEFEAIESTVPAVVDAFDGSVDRLVVDADGVQTTVTLPQPGDVRPLHEELEAQFGPVTLAARQAGTPGECTRPGFLATLDDALTDRQHTALKLAYTSGFFDWPRAVSGEELADAMDITPSTYHQHLRVAERKVLEAMFGD